MTESPVLIAGGGIGGLATALTRCARGLLIGGCEH